MPLRAPGRRPVVGAATNRVGDGMPRPAAEIFRAYDIRGVVGETLTGEVVYWVARALATEARAAGHARVVAAGDGRLSTAALRAPLLRGLVDGGVDVVDVGQVPTPLLYYATVALETGAGVMITGSHNPPEYNGLKMMLGGRALADAQIQSLRERIERRDFSTGRGGQGGGLGGGLGKVERIDIVPRYLDRVVADIAIAGPFKVVVDCGNGVAGVVAPRLLAAIGCEVVPLFAEVDGRFPNHHPDPAEAANLTALVAAVGAHRADLGVAFDGDGDRLGVVAETGEVIWPDRAMMLFARDILARNPGAGIVFDVKCSRHLPTLVRAWGGTPMMWKTGHSHIKAKIRSSGALFGGEFSGHFCFADRWFGFDDGIYSAARVAEIIAADGRPASEVFGAFPAGLATPEIKVATTEQAKFAIVRELVTALGDAGAEAAATLNDIDGLRVDFADGWGLVRASNTSPALSLRFEADDEAALARIQARFNAALRGVDEGLSFPPARPL